MKRYLKKESNYQKYELVKIKILKNTAFEEIN